MASQQRVRLEIFGRVQGVFFRASTREKAQELGVTGWVKNRSDGSVEALVEGPAQAVADLVEWAHHGPPKARVDDVEMAEEDYQGAFTGFEVRR